MLGWSRTVELLSMQTPECVIPRAMAKIDIGSSGDLFYKCPVGGFASLNPGICPKCNEPLVALSDTGSAAERLTVGNDVHNERRAKDEAR